MSTRPRLAALSLAAVGATALTAGLASGASRPAAPQAASVPTVVGYGHQMGNAKFDLFGLFASGVSNAATGTMTFYAGTPKQKLTTATVTCLQINGNDAIVSGTAKIDGVSTVVVAEAVDQGDPSGSPLSDSLRFSFAPVVTPTDTPGCYLPVLAPVAIKSGDLHVDAGA
jgi:hypothetical protein